MTNARIEFETITKETFDGLKSIVLEQAQHHESKYSGSDEDFIAALGRKDPVPQILMVRDDDTGKALGYILFNHYHGLKGQELYIEDICVAGSHRSEGFGLAMTEVLKDKGRELGVNGISWTVAENNPAAIRFYEKKMHASVLKNTVYDCGHVFAAPPAAAADYEVRKADAGDFALLDSYVGRIPGLTADIVNNLRDASGAPNASVYIALGTDGSPKAIGVTNSNYSSFRTVYGYKFELMELTADKADAKGAFAALTAHVVEQGKLDNHTGHLNICADNASDAQKEFVKSLGGSQLQMTDDPASVFLLYGIGRDIIYAPAPKPDAGSRPRSDFNPK